MCYQWFERKPMSENAKKKDKFATEPAVSPPSAEKPTKDTKKENKEELEPI